MSLGSIMSVAQSALQAAQAQVQVTSENVANANTVGYSRKTAVDQELVAGGVGEGVSVPNIQNVANQYLMQANLSATAQSGQAAAISNTLSQAENLFGDPTSSSSFFSNLDNVYTAFSAASATPSSSVLRQSAVSSVSTFLQSASDLSGNLSQLQSQASQKTGADITTANGLLQQISQLNGVISQATLSGGDPTGAQDQQNQLLSQLSGLMNVNVLPTSTGGVTVRSSEGVYLAGDQGAATLAYTQSGSATTLTATSPNGGAQAITSGGGEIGGLIQLSQVSLPQISAQLGEYVSQAVDQLNQASNASSTVPAPATLTGRQTGMDISTAVSSFSGATNIAIVNSSGVVQQQVAIDFSAGTMTVGGVPTSFTPSTFLSTLNTELGGAGTASFTNGVLSLSAASGDGVAIADDPTTPATNAGQGFSQFFGLNDMVVSSQNADFATGLTGADPNTFSGTISLQLSNSNGASLRQSTVTIPAGGTVSDVLTALNAGVGAYGSFSLDSYGRLAFTPNANSPVTLSVTADNTTNSVGGGSLSQMFGLGDASTAALSTSYSVRSDIAQNANNLSFAQLDLSAAAGTPALGVGDGSGALAMSESGQNSVSFASVGGQPAGFSSVSDYASAVAGFISNQASLASSAQATAAATATQAQSQLSSATGVNLDQELVNLTTYQQAYAASARLIQAANSMYDVLLQLAP